MKELFALFGKISVMLWLVLAARTFLYSLGVTGGALVLALQTKAWGDRNGSEQFILVLQMLGIQTGVILAFLDSTISKLTALANQQSQPNQKTS